MNGTGQSVRRVHTRIFEKEFLEVGPFAHNAIRKYCNVV